MRRAAKHAKEAASAQQEESIRRRKQATIEFLTNTPTLCNELKAALPYLDRTPSAATRLMARADKDDGVAKAVRSYLDYLENVATGVRGRWIVPLFSSDAALQPRIEAMLPLVVFAVLTDGLQAVFGFGLLGLRRTYLNLVSTAVSSASSRCPWQTSAAW